MPSYETKAFARFTRREKLTDASLMEAIGRAERGLIDADLGGGVIKQRVARPGQGSRGGYRTLLAFRSGSLSVFLYGFAKSERANIDPDELELLRAAGSSWLTASAPVISRAIAEGILIEVKHDDDQD